MTVYVEDSQAITLENLLEDSSSSEGEERTFEIREFKTYLLILRRSSSSCERVKTKNSDS
jgi:hypothetical protein